MGSRPKLYWALAPWFHLLTHPKAYAGEARWVRRALPAARPGAKPTMLELGSGGGNNAFHLKRHFTLTLTDLSPRMLAVSRRINPECEHIVGDMRTLRLKRRFDFVFVHDAVSYMTTERDLARAIRTAFAHCKPGGAALFQPDHVRETFRPSRNRGGHREGGRSLAYIETTHATAPGATIAHVEFELTLSDDDGSTRLMHDRHSIGVFPRATWLSILRAAGFRARTVVDPWQRVCFLARVPRARARTRPHARDARFATRDVK